MTKNIILCLLASLLSLTAAARTKDAIKVLAIGNSFSHDAVEQYLWELAADADVPMIIGNASIGGCSLDRHANNGAQNLPAYGYHKVETDGKRSSTDGVTLAQALADEQWDYVTIQQVSGFSGRYDTYHPFIDSLLVYVRARVPRKCKILFHQTWAYESTSNHGAFADYGRNQDTMYCAIVRTQRQIMKEMRLRRVLPSGTAVQNARTTSIGDHMTRDGFHLHLLHGRYTAACTWFEVLTGKSVLKSHYAPEGLSPRLTRATRLSAHKAVRKPWKVTPIKDNEQ